MHTHSHTFSHNCAQDDDGKRSKTPKAGGGKKKGKGGAANDYAPGKKKSAMKTRKEEAAIIDFIGDEPAAGPDEYWLMHGLSDPEFVAAMAECGASVCAVINTTTVDDDDDEKEEQEGKEQGVGDGEEGSAHNAETGMDEQGKDAGAEQRANAVSAASASNQSANQQVLAPFHVCTPVCVGRGSLSLTHTHTHTHTLSLSLSLTC